jgi:hypothetical protein
MNVNVMTGLTSLGHELKGKSAIVTGSTSGIGLGIARALAARGVNIMSTGSARLPALTMFGQNSRKSVASPPPFRAPICRASRQSLK